MTPSLLSALLDSWQRNNTILINLLRAIPEGSLGVRSVEGGPTAAQLLTHMHSVRLSLVAENAPEFVPDLLPDLPPEEEWSEVRNAMQIEQMLNASARTVLDAVEGRILAGQPMTLHYDHPVLLLQHLIWHEGYHHGQIKLALKIAGQPLSGADAGPGTWGVWMDKET